MDKLLEGLSLHDLLVQLVRVHEDSLMVEDPQSHMRMIDADAVADLIEEVMRSVNR